MKAVFRVDASLRIGTGHVMRCLTLARALKALGMECHFICRDHPGNLTPLIQNSSFPVYPLAIRNDTHTVTSKADTPLLAYAEWLGATQEQDAGECTPILQSVQPDWLIVDHYSTDIRWETSLKPHYRKLLVIDDLADRRHHCDILLDQNWSGENTNKRYEALVPTHTIKLLGPRYALIDPEYALLRRLMPPRDGIVRRVMVFLGGSDEANQTAKVLMALMSPGFTSLAADVVIGMNHPDPTGIANLVGARPNTFFHQNLPSLASLMVRADLTIGAGGAATWERMSVGLPSIVISIANNQTATSVALMKADYIDFIGEMADVTVEDIAAAVRRALAAPTRLKEQSARMQQLVPALGLQEVCEHVTGRGSIGVASSDATRLAVFHG